MKRCIMKTLLILLLLASAGQSLTFAQPRDLKDYDLPPLVIDNQPPKLVVVPCISYPNEYIYMIPSVKDVYIYRDRIYRHYHSRWFYSYNYIGNFLPLPPDKLPLPILSMALTPTPSIAPVGLPTISFTDYIKHREEWQRTKHFHNEKWFIAEQEKQRKHFLHEQEASNKEHKSMIPSRPGPERHIDGKENKNER